MISISVCMIVKNEEAVLSRCLDCVAVFADEIIIVDTGSIDATKSIAGRYTDKVYDFEWCNDFSAARNYSLSKATSQYVMWLDADDVIDKENQDRLLEFKAKLTTNPDTVFCHYDIAFDDNDKPTFSYFRERILKNCPLARFGEPVHEAITPFGKIEYSDIHIRHKKESRPHTKRNLDIYQNLIKSKAPLSPRAKYYYSRELMHNGYTKRAVTAFKNFLKDKNGWIENRIDAHICLAECYRTLKMTDEAIEILLKGMSLCCPRAKSCCLLGSCFLEKNMLPAAAFWYESALKCKTESGSMGFSERSYGEFLPAISLSVVYDRLGDKQTANSFNELAGSYNPKHPAYIYNKEYFEKLLSK